MLYLHVGVLREFCQLETFRPRCWKNEVVVIDKALYGRRQVNRCIREDEKAFLDDRRFFNCYANVLAALDDRCSGRKQCEVRVPDAELEQSRSCLHGLQMFLEVSYDCVEGTTTQSLHLQTITMSDVTECNNST